MYPESMAPSLEGYEDFKRAAEERGLRVLRTYTPNTITDTMRRSVSDFEGEPEPDGWWDVILVKEELREDGKLHSFFMTVSDRAMSVPTSWERHFELLELGWQNYLERAGVTPDREVRR